MRSDIGACSADESETGTESFTLSQPGIKTWLLGLQSRASANSPQTSSLHRAVLLPVSGGGGLGCMVGFENLLCKWE